MTDLPDQLRPYRYSWPASGFSSTTWQPAEDPRFLCRELPETREQLRTDSRWPTLFPSPIGLVTAALDRTVALDKVVGVSIVNRFPYLIAVSLCREDLSARHHPRGTMAALIEAGAGVAVQFLAPGAKLDRAMDAIATVPEDQTGRRIAEAGLSVRGGAVDKVAVLSEAYLVYECQLARPGVDLDGVAILDTPWQDVGSHRIYYLEVRAIQLDETIAQGRRSVRWRSLPDWPGMADEPAGAAKTAAWANLRYRKDYNPDYRFPQPGATVAFEPTYVADGMAVRLLPHHAGQQVEVDNDRARWPCYFPSSLGYITAWSAEGKAMAMPCGSTLVVSRSPFIIATAISYGRVNERYAPRQTRLAIGMTGRFGCGVCRRDPRSISAITYGGNVSYADDPEKFVNAGLTPVAGARTPMAAEWPVFLDCRVVGSTRLGTHELILGEVERIFARRELEKHPLEWVPWAALENLS